MNGKTTSRTVPLTKSTCTSQVPLLPLADHNQVANYESLATDATLKSCDVSEFRRFQRNANAATALVWNVSSVQEQANHPLPLPCPGQAL